MVNDRPASPYAYVLSLEYYLENKESTNSEIPIVKVWYLLIKFSIGCLGQELADLVNRKNIKDIVREPSLDNTEKLYFIICYLNHRVVNAHTCIDNDIKNFIGNLNEWDESIIKECLDNQVDYNVLYQLISCIKNNDIKKKTLLEILIEKLHSVLKEDKRISTVISNSTLLGKILLALNSQKIKDIEECFMQVFDLINEPYLFYRNNKQWENSIVKLWGYFVIIFIFYSEETSKVRYYALQIQSLRPWYQAQKSMFVEIAKFSPQDPIIKRAFEAIDQDS